MLQTIGRAARNENGKVLLYADGFSPAMEASIRQTLERRQRQQANNEALGITPKTIVKALPVMGETEDATITGTTTGSDGKRRLIAKKGGRKDGDWAQRLRLGAGSWGATEKQENQLNIQTHTQPTTSRTTLVHRSLRTSVRRSWRSCVKR